MPINTIERSIISVAEFVRRAPSELEIEVLAGADDLNARRIESERVGELGLALAGATDGTRADAIQIVGRSETSYLAKLAPAQKIEAAENLDAKKICCLLIVGNLDAPAELLSFAKRNRLPVLRTRLESSKAIQIVTAFLSDALAPQSTVHGVLVGMYGIGVLLVGDSGIGKSECALDLIAGGHQLVADDAVVVKRIGGALVGSSPDLTYEHLEVRGLGIVNVRNLFGVWSVAPPKRIVLSIEFKKWRDALEVDRLGLEQRETEILGVKIAEFTLPVSAGRNLATLVETAVRVYLQRIAGVDAARDFVEKHSAMLSAGKFGDVR